MSVRVGVKSRPNDVAVLLVDMEQTVLTYIAYLHSRIKERPQCMLVAMMLKLKFSTGEIVYNTGHFITLIDGKHSFDGGFGIT